MSRLSASNVAKALEASNSVTTLAEFLGVSRQALYRSKLAHVQAALAAMRGRRFKRAIRAWTDEATWQRVRATGVPMSQAVREGLELWLEKR